MIENKLNRLKQYLKTFSNEYDIEEGQEKRLLLTKNKEIISSFSIYGNTEIQDVYNWIDKEFNIYVEPKKAFYVLVKDIDDVELLHDYFKDNDYVFVKSFDAESVWDNICDNQRDQETKDFIRWIEKNYSLPDYLFFYDCDPEKRAEVLGDVLNDEFYYSKYIFKFIKKGENNE